MAQDWIKMRCELQTHPKVVRILSATRADKFRVIGGLHAVWSVFDAHSSDGTLEGYTPEVLDHIIGWEGFSAAMESVGWLVFDGEETLSLPEFTEHNGQSAKRRAEDQKRKRDDRKRPESVRKSCGQNADELRTREEKRREEEEQEKPAQARTTSIGLKAFLAECESAGEDPIPANDPVFAYADRIGLPHDFVALAWEWFKARYAAKRQAGVRGWRQTFRNAVEGNWPKYWFADEAGGWGLTTAGKQAQRAQR